jgi:hypothetical protein
MKNDTAINAITIVMPLDVITIAQEMIAQIAEKIISFAG